MRAKPSLPSPVEAKYCAILADVALVELVADVDDRRRQRRAASGECAVLSEAERALRGLRYVGVLYENIAPDAAFQAVAAVLVELINRPGLAPELLRSIERGPFNRSRRRGAAPGGDDGLPLPPEPPRAA